MTLLMYSVDPEHGALIITDTLMTDADNRPYLYVNKCQLVPHMNMAVAGTGNGNLLSAWHRALNGSMAAIDIDMCALHAQGALRHLWSSVCDEFEIDPIVGDDALGTRSTGGRTSTVYHFGQSFGGDFVWHVFRSNHDFELEVWEGGGFALKPAPMAGLSADQAPQSLDEMIELAELVRAEQNRRPLVDRVAVGGELWLTALDEDGMAQRRLHRFDDWEDTWIQISDRAQRN